MGAIASRVGKEGCRRNSLFGKTIPSTGGNAIMLWGNTKDENDATSIYIRHGKDKVTHTDDCTVSAGQGVTS